MSLGTHPKRLWYFLICGGHTFGTKLICQTPCSTVVMTVKLQGGEGQTVCSRNANKKECVVYTVVVEMWHSSVFSSLIVLIMLFEFCWLFSKTTYTFQHI